MPQHAKGRVVLALDPDVVRAFTDAAQRIADGFASIGRAFAKPARTLPDVMAEIAAPLGPEEAARARALAIRQQRNTGPRPGRYRTNGQRSYGR